MNIDWCQIHWFYDIHNTHYTHTLECTRLLLFFFALPQLFATVVDSTAAVAAVAAVTVIVVAAVAAVSVVHPNPGIFHCMHPKTISYSDLATVSEWCSFVYACLIVLLIITIIITLKF